MREPKIPDYVYDLLWSFLTGEPLNFHNHAVPVEVQLVLAEAVKDGTLNTVSYVEKEVAHE